MSEPITPESTQYLLNLIASEQWSPQSVKGRLSAHLAHYRDTAVRLEQAQLTEEQRHCLEQLAERNAKQYWGGVGPLGEFWLGIVAKLRAARADQG